MTAQLLGILFLRVSHFRHSRFQDTDTQYFLLIVAPLQLALRIKEKAGWFIKYTILKKPYDDNAKVCPYLIDDEIIY